LPKVRSLRAHPDRYALLHSLTDALPGFSRQAGFALQCRLHIFKSDKRNIQTFSDAWTEIHSTKTSNMETTTQKILLGKNLASSSKFGDNLIEGAICLDILEDPIVKRLTYEYQGKKYLNIKVVKRKEVTSYGKTHYMEIDVFVPTKQTEVVQTAIEQQ
jgi:hypothetical protein